VSPHIAPLRITPLPPCAAAPLSLMHAASFPDEPWDAAAFARILELSGVFGWLAWTDDSPSGFLVARDLGDEAEVLTIGVLPEARRRGIGRALLDVLVAEAERLGLGSVVLEVAADNDAAQRLYASCGFVRVGRRPRYYRRAETVADALILRLGLQHDVTGEASSQ
jgi:[ribosomal protein S18]-alanine N-acetyltransferase